MIACSAGPCGLPLQLAWLGFAGVALDRHGAAVFVVLPVLSRGCEGGRACAQRYLVVQFERHVPQALYPAGLTVLPYSSTGSSATCSTSHLRFTSWSCIWRRPTPCRQGSPSTGIELTQPPAVAITIAIMDDRRRERSRRGKPDGDGDDQHRSPKPPAINVPVKEPPCFHLVYVNDVRVV